MHKNFLILLLAAYFTHASESGLDDEGNPIPLNHYVINNNDKILSSTITKKERCIWEKFSEIIPKKYRPEIKEFEPIDGNSGIDGSIHAVSEDKLDWVVQLDTHGSIPESELNRTMIHEFAHLLTLRLDQIPLSKMSEYDLANSCDTYYLVDGCTNLNSYLNIFVSEFWNHHLPVYSDEKTIASRYKNNRNEFVTEYAATNPAEDIAESFAEYVLAEQLPKPTSIANRKIRFFSNYPKLVEIKNNIRKGLLVVSHNYNRACK
ncbi:hypothetical protein [Vibrio mediterranei]|uniref:hypothetical protein n=1 Tax=Vibrio mediterranei TaxID=689 RepID=UPI00148E5CB4|nr:hypothetical protein [Vibrio mediterranei]NOI26834.1 hypothetical protein [Vibrio mediterranei]